MGLYYYFYYAGDNDFANKVEEILAKKDFDAFMKLYRKEDKRSWCRLSNHAYDEENDESVSILTKENFERITGWEYECG